MDSLDRLNKFYDEILGKPLIGGNPVTAEEQLQPPPPPSLEALEGWVRRPSGSTSLSSETYCRLDASLENIEEVRRSER